MYVYVRILHTDPTIKMVNILSSEMLETDYEITSQ